MIKEHTAFGSQGQQIVEFEVQGKNENLPFKYHTEQENSRRKEIWTPGSLKYNNAFGRVLDPRACYSLCFWVIIPT